MGSVELQLFKLNLNFKLGRLYGQIEKKYKIV